MIKSEKTSNDTRVYRMTTRVPVSISWHKELVDDGAKGSNFYMKITPRINLGRAVRKVQEGGHTKIVSKKADNEMRQMRSMIVRDFTPDIKKAAKAGMKK